ncbi:MAG: dephospho-CoA kinase [Chloroflexi bacterium]|nr:dephospho-CoA kinase [Chloroflexota bacterium]
MRRQAATKCKGPYIIGLTGNIATGKSLVAGILNELGAEIIDADKLAHEVVQPGTEVYRQVVSIFGKCVIRSDGEIDRVKLGQIVFADPEAMRRLEKVIHPAVIARVQEILATTKATVVVIEAIKLLETGMDSICDAIWVVTSPREVQVQRLMEERGLTQQEAKLRIDAQPSQEEKILRADVVIDNGGTIAATRDQVSRLWAQIPVFERTRERRR